jgi:RNA polymerase sigma-70 factor (ECF subfamily)
VARVDVDDVGVTSERENDASGPIAVGMAVDATSRAQSLGSIDRPPVVSVGALDEIMAEYGDTIYSQCLRVLRDPVKAQDVLQQVFLEVHRDIGRFEGRASLRTWIFSIALHRCKDMIKTDSRRERRIQADEDALLAFRDPADGPEAQVARSRMIHDLERCLNELSPNACLAVLARFKLELSFEEMAPLLDAKPDTLQTRVMRSLPTLKRCLERKGWTDA